MTTDPKTAALEQLAALVAEREDLEGRITAQVAAARQERATWTAITTALTPPGADRPLLRPNVERKYKALLDEQVTVTVRETEA